ncbi:MAG: hypothetical protein HY040_29220 [Planctomycetes bacterium]|nr:hypothetical protein [Planctomycetota bacterium]
MARLFSFLTPCLLLLVPNAAHAQEAPEIEIDFVRKLRDKGYSDLALEYIDKLKKTDPKLTDPKWAQLLTLEQGRALAALARQKEPEQRATLSASARALLEEFVQKNPSGPENVLARLEIARLANFQGEILLSKALRQEEGKAQDDIAKKAEQQFLQAGQALEAAIKGLPGNERLQARFDWALNLINASRTFMGPGKLETNRRRGDHIDGAKKILETIAAADQGETGALAQAWLVKCYQDIQDPTAAKKSYDRVMGLSGKSAVAAQRAAKVFYIQGLDNPTLKLDTKKKLNLIEDECKKWLAAYPAHHHTAEGWAVRYELGVALLRDGQQFLTGKEKTPPTEALARFDQAQKHFNAIVESNGDLSVKANQKNLQIGYLKLGEKTAVADLKDFDECFLKAHVEMLRAREADAEMERADENERAGLEKKRDDHHKTSMQALTRALNMADAKTPAAKVDDARYFLTAGYFASGDLQRAAVAGDALARTRPPSKRAATAAGHAIRTYANLAGRDPGDDGARMRLKDLAAFVLAPENAKTWAGEPVLGIARYELAHLHLRDNDYEHAIEELERIPRDYAGYIYAQAELALIARRGWQETKNSEDEKRFRDRALAAIARMNPLPADADPATTFKCLLAQLTQASFVRADAFYSLRSNDLPKASQNLKDLTRFLDEFKARYDKLPKDRLGREARETIEQEWDAWKKNLRSSMAEIDYRSGQYDKVLASTAETVAAALKQKGDMKAPIKMKDHRAVTANLVLALRAKVQTGKIDEARDLINIVERIRGEDESELEKIDLPQILIGDIKNQVEALKKSGDKDKLQSVVSNFGAFVDELAKKLDPKSLKPAELSFFAQAYSSLDQYGKAADLFARIPAPKCLDQTNLTADEEQEIAVYWALQLQYAKALRLDAKTKENPAAAKEEFIRSKKVLDKIQKHKNGRQQLVAEEEGLHILEDIGNYGSASNGWSAIMNSVKKQLAVKPANETEAKRHQLAKEHYFGAFYQRTWCNYKYSQTKPVMEKPGVEKQFLSRAAADIYELETSKSPEGWQIVGSKYQELLRNEPKLNAAYEELKKAKK